MRIRCWRCGHTRIIFTTQGDRFGDHHGAVCASCNKPITLKDCLFTADQSKGRKENNAFTSIQDATIHNSIMAALLSHRNDES